MSLFLFDESLELALRSSSNIIKPLFQTKLTNGLSSVIKKIVSIRSIRVRNIKK